MKHPVTDLAGALAVTRDETGLSQEKLARKLHVTDGMISALECGRANFPLGLLPEICRALDHPRFYGAAALAANGGVGPMWHDGPRADHHRLTARDRALREIGHARAALERFGALIESVEPDQLGAEGDKQFEVALDQLADVVDQGWNALGDLCRWGGRSFAEVWDHRRRELIAGGYLSGGREVGSNAQIA